MTKRSTSTATTKEETTGTMIESVTAVGAGVTEQVGGLVGINTKDLAISQDFEAELGITSVQLTVHRRKPGRQDWFRTHPDRKWRLTTAVLEDKLEGETYLVDKALWPSLGDEIVPKLLIPTITKQGMVSIWSIRLPGPDGRLDEYNRSALGAAQIAETQWIRMKANRGAGAYEVQRAPSNASNIDPIWPELTFDELINRAFHDHFITTANHPVLRRLRGE